MVTRPKQKKLALSMRGGGVRAGGYIGVLKALEEANIKIDMIIGSSAGAVIGGAYAAGVSLEKIQETFIKFKPRRYFGWQSLRSVSLVSNNRVINLFRRLVGDIDILETKIKLYIQATNLTTYKSEILEKGPLAKSIVASGAAPLLLRPVEIEGTYYIDGDVCSGYAVDFLKKKGAAVVIGINSHRKKIKEKNHLRLHNRIAEPFIASTRKIRDLDQLLYPVDLMIGDLGVDIPLLKGKEGTKLVNKGYKKTKKLLPKINNLLFS